MKGTAKLKEAHCPKCGGLLFRSENKNCIIEIKCRKCGGDPLIINPAETK